MAGVLFGRSSASFRAAQLNASQKGHARKPLSEVSNGHENTLSKSKSEDAS
jgi:hypothetical protein